MKKIISLVFMFISCIGIYAQQIMDATAAYKKANDLLERLNDRREGTYGQRI